MARNQQLRRMVTAAAIFAAMLAAAPGAMAAPSNPAEAVPTAEPVAVAQFVGEYSWVESRCAASVYPLCLYYNSSMDTAWWATTVNVRDLAPYKFWAGTGAGAGQPVKNNAAAVSCDLPRTWTCFIYFNSGWMGNRDWLYGQQSGRLQLTKNENASVAMYDFKP
jgi:hypothetical protein